MSTNKTSRKKAIFGDFQTPPELAASVCRLLARLGLEPNTLLEPTCGRGELLLAALNRFPSIRQALGVEIDGAHVRQARESLAKTSSQGKVVIRQDDFYRLNWRRLLSAQPDPLLVLGNLPWVTNAGLGTLSGATNAGLGTLSGANLPSKSNFKKRSGIDALTGSSNFDISEWMLLQCLSWMRNREATLAMLCKTSVARKILLHGWEDGYRIKGASLYRIDAAHHFGAAVDACLLVLSVAKSGHARDCLVHEGLEEKPAVARWGFREGTLVADADAYSRYRHLQSDGNLHNEAQYRWRSGIKHDCARVMELRFYDGGWRNGLGERVELEAHHCYPLLKGSDVARGEVTRPLRRMVVPQHRVGEDTEALRFSAPTAWAYLEKHGDKLDRRASSVYRGRPRFSIFGVGDYAFAPFKVVIAGFYKKLEFAVVGSFEGQPIVLDDTCYFLPCSSMEEATLLARLLNSEVAKRFYSGFVFWDEKRPVTLGLLRRLDILRLAEALWLDAELKASIEQPGIPHRILRKSALDPS